MDVITIMMDRPRYENEVIPEDIPLNIVYEDKYLMVVNKPAGLVVHPRTRKLPGDFSERHRLAHER